MNEFDERQLWIRGNIFKHALMLLGGLTILDYLYASVINDTHLFGSMTGVVNIMIVTMVGGIEMIRKDAYERQLGTNKFVGIIMSVVGLGTMIVRCIEFVNGEIKVYTMEGKEDIGMFVISVCLFIFGAYYLYNSYKHKNDDE